MSNDRSPHRQRYAGARATLVAAAIAVGGIVGAATGAAQAAPLVPAPTGTLAAQDGVVVAVHGWRHGGWGHHHGWGHRHGWHRGPRWGWGHHHHRGWGGGWRHGGWRHHHRW